MVEAVGFEPTCFLGIRFTVWRFQPLTHTSKIVNALLPMRVLKHTIPTDKLLVQGTGKLIPVLLICFNTLWFFAPQKEFHPTGRPFVCFLVCSDGTSFPYCTKWKTLEFLVPGSFWVSWYLLQYMTPQGPLGSWKCIHATIAVRPGTCLEHGFNQWTYLRFHSINYTLYILRSQPLKIFVCGIYATQSKMDAEDGFEPPFSSLWD